MFDPRHANVDPSIAGLVREIREWEIKLLSARTQQQKLIIRGEIGHLRARFLHHQDEPWPVDVERVREGAGER